MLVFISIVFQINAWLFKNIHIKVHLNLLKYNIVKKMLNHTNRQTDIIGKYFCFISIYTTYKNKNLTKIFKIYK